MRLFVISDLHLSFGCDKPMDVFKGWENYVEKIEKNWRHLIEPEDTVVIPGDLSWGLKIEETLEDFKFLEGLPGTKVFIKGNHDLWWSTATKVKKFLIENNINSLEIVFNNSYAFGKYAVCGTRGWIFEGKSADKKVILREASRLDTSITDAENRGLIPIVFLHYPAVWGDEKCEEILSVLKNHDIKTVYHGHIHGTYNLPDSYEYDGITFKLISCDCINFTPYYIISG